MLSQTQEYKQSQSKLCLKLIKTNILTVKHLNQRQSLKAQYFKFGALR